MSRSCAGYSSKLALRSPDETTASPVLSGLCVLRHDRLMRLERVKLENFRCYHDEIDIPIRDFAALIGKNDAGKSSVLEAIAIFFGTLKADRDDASKIGDPKAMTITCEFDELPDSLVLDSANATSLASEYLLNTSGRLEVVHVYDGTLKAPSKKVFLRAAHPSADGASDLLALKISELKARAEKLGVSLDGVNKTMSAPIRAAIRDHFDSLGPVERLLAVSEDGTKDIYSRIQEELPSFFLFGADRASTDQDAEAQDPMKAAVAVAVAAQKESLEIIAVAVKEQLSALVTKTVEKIALMSPTIAAGLTPRLNDELKWESVFKVSLDGESDIPLNKRGSGVRRMILLGFLQAQAELQSGGSNIIYAIEEPETGQHPDMQRALLSAVREISERPGCQVVLTTHTPTLGKLVPEDSLRYIAVSEGNHREVLPGGDTTSTAVADALGILPDHNVKVFVGVEGKHDINHLLTISKILSQSESDIDDLGSVENIGRLIFVPAGGSNVALWVSRLRNLNIPEFHLFDRDTKPPANAKYKQYEDSHNKLANCEAVHTQKRELENYLHIDAIRLARPDLSLTDVDEFDSIPLMCAQSVYAAEGLNTSWDDLTKESRKSKTNSVKTWLNTHAVAHMSAEMLTAVDPDDALRGWLRRITELVRA